MNKWPLTAVAILVALSAGTLVVAQTADDRKALIQSTNTSKLTQLGADFQAEHERNEDRVLDYLKKHPGQKRSFKVGTATHYLSRIDADGKPVYITTKDVSKSSNGLKNRASGDLIKSNSLYPGGSLGINITGTGMVAGIWDGGLVRPTHELLAGRVANQAGQINTGTEPTGFDDHMTHVSGTMVGKDLTGVAGASANAIAARGLAYNATAQNYDWIADQTEMTAFAGAGGLVSNHSYGYLNESPQALWTYGAYDAVARAWDQIAQAAPYYLPFVAAGNEQLTNGNTGKTGLLQGYDVITGSSAAKNVMTIGAVDGAKSIATYTNFGPTDDGRLKPDLVAKGTGINSAQTSSDTDYSGTVNSDGTSYATPAAAAGALLLQQYFNSLYGNYMLASTLKALMINTAEDLGRAGPDVQFGWGLINLEAAATAIKKRSGLGSPAALSYNYATSKGAIIEEITFNPGVGSEMNREFFAKGGEAVKATLCWTDDPGIEQMSADGVDPTTTRAVYSFGLTMRSFAGPGFAGSITDDRHWNTPTMAAPTAAATRASDNITRQPNNCVQALATNANPAAGTAVRLYMRKHTGSPSTARTISLVVTGVIENAVTITPVATGPGTNAISCNSSASPSIIASGSSRSCTVTPASGNYVVSVTGSPTTACTPTLTSGNTYSTGNVTADCTITATFAAIVDGACGTASGVATLAAPTANLCNPGTAVSPGSTATTYTWTCNSPNVGTNGTCSAPRLYTITSGTGANGTLSCDQTQENAVAGPATTCTATPAIGYRTASITPSPASCSTNPATGTGVNSYSTGGARADCTITAAFELIPAVPVNGVCGTANGVGTYAAPTSNQCSTGTFAAGTTSGGNFNWTCTGANGGTTASCAAPALAPLGNVTPGAGGSPFTGTTVPASGGTAGAASASFTTTDGGASCRFEPTAAATAFVGSPAAYPTAGSTQPQGFFRFKLVGCTAGFSARVSVTWPISLTGMTYVKYGNETSTATSAKFFAPNNLSISGNVASFDVTDGQKGDNDWAVNGEIIDPTGPVLLPRPQVETVAVPTLDNPALLALIFLMLGAGLVLRRRTQR